FTWAVVDFNVQVETPDALVAEQAPRVLFVPLAEKVGVTPGTGTLLASARVIVTVELAIPSANTGLVPAMVEWAAAAGPKILNALLVAAAVGWGSCPHIERQTVAVSV